MLVSSWQNATVRIHKCLSFTGYAQHRLKVGKCIYIAHFLWYLTFKAFRHGSHSYLQLHQCLPLSVHQMAPPETEVADV